MQNPLIETFKTPFGTIPFEEIKLEHFKPAFEKAIKIGKAEIEKIKSNSEKPNFENTIEALERCGSLLNTVSTIFFNLNSAETSSEMQKLAQKISPLLTNYSNEIVMDEVLFQRIKQVYKNKKTENLNSEQEMLLEETYLNFIDNGANLNAEEKTKLKEINTKLSKLSLTFGENVLKDSNKFQLEITNKEDLAGLPEGIIEASAEIAKQKIKPNSWIFTLDYPSYIPFMQYAENRKLRKKMFLAFGSRAFKKNKFNNEIIVLELVKLKQEKAQILGFKSHADKTLKQRMAKNSKNVFELLTELETIAKPKAVEELKEIQKFAKTLGFANKMERWDFSFYSEKLKKEKFSINDELLKPYFKLENVLDGAFQVANKLYSIKFKELTNIQKYHADVVTYEVLDKNNRHLAIFYADFFPREGKRNGAWMTSYRGQNKYDNAEQRPHISIVCNFTKPTETKPSLLTFNEVTTLFHEFGHALHGIFANTHYESLSGTSVYWDFVELPSQIMENWCFEKEALEIFARHFETNETIPMEFIQKIKDSSNYLSAYQTLRQVNFAKLDMAWHSLERATNQTVADFENAISEPLDLFPKVDGTNMSCSFSHIFSGGYSAGYYSYKWAEVLEADAFEYFKEKGIFNSEIGEKFRENILSQGGTKHPMELYLNFRGKKPNSKALLRKSGLVK